MLNKVTFPLIYKWPSQALIFELVHLFFYAFGCLHSSRPSGPDSTRVGQDKGAAERDILFTCSRVLKMSFGSQKGQPSSQVRRTERSLGQESQLIIKDVFVCMCADFLETLHGCKQQDTTQKYRDLTLEAFTTIYRILKILLVRHKQKHCMLIKLLSSSHCKIDQPVPLPSRRLGKSPLCHSEMVSETICKKLVDRVLPKLCSLRMMTLQVFGARRCPVDTNQLS